MRITKKQKIALWSIAIIGMVIWLAGLPLWIEFVKNVLFK